MPCIYVHLLFLLPKTNQPLKRYWVNILITSLLVLVFSWINYSFFSVWSNALLPDYFFISYFSFGQVLLFFAIYIVIASLLRLSKSWFIVNELEKELLKGEREKAELELKALRAQMNPHFIFNCMNSIKALIQQKEDEKATTYLTTLAKLIRTIFENSDKREISLYDEIETCRLYTQLEHIRFGNKFNYTFSIDESADLKSFMVPALIIQPFIENAIWHGIMPKENDGYLNLSITVKNGDICCIIDDNGIGREMSKQNKFKKGNNLHQSKGLQLTQARLGLDGLINHRSATVEIIDKKDGSSNGCGTTAILHFRQY
jgi:sensor histidine kinase YesM